METSSRAVIDELNPLPDRPLRILLVDPDPADRREVLGILEQGGLRVDPIEVSDIDDAVRALTHHGPFDCLLIDHLLPHGEGFEVLERVSALGLSTPAIVFTEHEDATPAMVWRTRVAAAVVPRSRASAERLLSSIVHVLRAQALRRREAEAREALAQNAARLNALVECSARVHAASSVEEIVECAAREALALFEAREARVDLNPHEADEALSRTAAAGALDGSDAGVVEVLCDARKNPVGRLVLVGASALDEVTFPAMRAQFARVVVGAIENAWLLRAATRACDARDDVLAVVGHDLRSPLGVVLMGSSLLRKSFAARGDSMDEDLGVVLRIDRACKQMQRLIEDMLDAARLDAGTFAVNPKPLPASALLVDAIDGISIAAAAAKVTVRVGAVEPVRVMADRDRMMQVLSNLVGNALKYTPAEGEIVLSVRASAGEATFTVTDSGAGIPAEQIPLLFGRYWKGTGVDRAGLGLGLYIAQGIVKAHHGRISARSDPGRGSAFVFTIPSAP